METQGIAKGGPGYTRATIAMLAAGLATFSTLYSSQAILPVLSSSFGISPTTAALTVSLTTGALAVCVVPASILSEKTGRGPMLIASVLVASLLGLATVFAPNIWALLGLRLLQGVALAGVPAVAMTWINEEITARDVTHAMGIYIAGNSLGGIFGRILPAVGVDLFESWRIGFAINAAFGITLSLFMAWALPAQRRFQPHPISLAREARTMLGHWRTPTLAALFAVAFTNMGMFVSFYNYLGFRMTGHFGLSPALVGLLFLLYLSGTWTSARAGAWSARWSRPRVMVFSAICTAVGLVLCFTPWLIFTMVGTLLFTAAFFLTHSLASSWVGAAAGENRSEASSMYLLCYYVGSSVLGWVSGFIYASFGWAIFITWLLVWALTLIAITAGLAGGGGRLQRIIKG